MVEGPAISDLFSQFVSASRTKLLILGSFGASSESLMGRFRSLNLEHVSPAELLQQEISRRTPLGLAAERRVQNGQTVSDETIVSLLRRWFWMRKPDAGFVLTDFPATLLQAKVFDEWLEARGESLDAVIQLTPGPNDSIVEYYRTLGLLMQASEFAAA